jgi:hypothetical protein
MLRAFGSCFRRLSCINRSSNFCLEQVGFGLKIKNSLPLVRCNAKAVILQSNDDERSR